MGIFNILITGIGTASALSVLKGLRSQNQYKVRTIGLDVDGFVSGRFFVDRFYTSILPSKPDAFARQALEILQKEKIDLVVPIIDYEFPVWAKLKEEGKAGKASILMSPSASVEICQDKMKTVSFFRELQIPTVEILGEEGPITRFPVLIKPRHFGRASLDVHIAEDAAELDFWIRKMKGNYLIEEYIEGEEFTVDCLSTLEGKFLKGLVRKRIATKGGLSVKAEAVRNDFAISCCQKIVEALQIPGVCNIQFFKKGENYYFIEVNPRFAGAHAFSVEAGLNIIFHLLQMLDGKTIDPSTIEIAYGMKMVRFWDEVIVEAEKEYTPGHLRR